ncbi:PRA1 family protein H [Linum grandiflorum]
MVFSANPLSASVPDAAFESWLTDSGYLELIDQHSSSSSSSAPTACSNNDVVVAAASSSDTSITGGIFDSLFSGILILLSVFTVNPFSKLTAQDLSGGTPSWTRAFIGDCTSYSLPGGSDQARLRLQENVKRYAKNYATLFVTFFACTLYQMPLALIGLISCLAVWDLFKFCNERWGWDRHPLSQQVLVRTAQCASAVILIMLNVQKALLCAVAVSYAVMIMHATFRKLTSPRQPPRKK